MSETGCPSYKQQSQERVRALVLTEGIHDACSPLDVACQNYTVTPEVLQLLVAPLDEEELKKKLLPKVDADGCSRGISVLHRLCWAAARPSAILWALTLCPEAAAVPFYTTGETPLHVFVKSRARHVRENAAAYAPALTALLEAAPSAVLIRSSSKVALSLPFHEACKAWLPATLLRILAEWTPRESILQIAGNGRTVLHLLCSQFVAWPEMVGARHFLRYVKSAEGPCAALQLLLDIEPALAVPTPAGGWGSRGRGDDGSDSAACHADSPLSLATVGVCFYQHEGVAANRQALDYFGKLRKVRSWDPRTNSSFSQPVNFLPPMPFLLKLCAAAVSEGRSYEALQGDFRGREGELPLPWTDFLRLVRREYTLLRRMPLLKLYLAGQPTEEEKAAAAEALTAMRPAEDEEEEEEDYWGSMSTALWGLSMHSQGAGAVAAAAVPTGSAAASDGGPTGSAGKEETVSCSVSSSDGLASEGV